MGRVQSPENTRIAIVGSEGYIGKALAKCFESHFSVVEIDRNRKNEFFLDLEQPSNFDFGVFDSCKYVILTAAISSPDLCENSYEKAYNINVIGTRTVIEQAMEHDCKVVFLSSDAVYGEDMGKAFDERSYTNPKTAYGKMKKEIEDLFKEDQLFKSVRLSYVISRRDKFMRYVEDCIKSNLCVEVFHPFYRNCVTLTEVTKSIHWLIGNWSDYKSPFLNICGPELISRLRIVDELNRFFETKIQYKVIYPEKEFFEVRPEITEMSSLYLGGILGEVNDSFLLRIKREMIKK